MKNEKVESARSISEVYNVVSEILEYLQNQRDYYADCLSSVDTEDYSTTLYARKVMAYDDVIEKLVNTYKL